MTAVQPFDPGRPLAPGRTIIEASAGTGKTFTIAATVARLVAEGRDLDRILVVTFTRAATAELKNRVRNRLVETAHALGGEAPDDPDDHLQVLLSLPEPVRREASARLSHALTDFDRAQVFTIHGFAQRLLGQLGFRVRLSDTLDPGEVDDLLLRQVASDIAVARFSRAALEDTILDPSLLIRLGREVIDHPDATVVPAPEQADGEAGLRATLAREVAAETRRRMRSAGATTYDDGLLEVRDALTDPEIGGSATDLLRRLYDIALVDESQDTDPTQWQIIRRVFDRTRLVVIGDPKQSIYSFRGADIESYLSAVEGASAHLTLSTNWRSDAPLVSALDVLFTGATFGDERIQYREVRAATPSARIRGLGPPLHVRLLDSDLPLPRRQNQCFLVDPCRDAVAADAAEHVVRLLSDGLTLEDENDRPVGPADIAILCRKRGQVDKIRRELDRRGVPNVGTRTGPVLRTDAAEEWRRFLLAVERPDRLDLVRLASTTCLVGETLERVAGLDDDAALDLQRQMREWHDLLQAGGVPALLSQLDHGTGLTERILSLPNGERLLTDLTHIAEELHSIHRRSHHGSLAAWLETSMVETAQREESQMEEPDSRQRRLETDAEAVTVQTIHGAKGLQYPIVLVPYAWDVWIGDPAYPVFHDTDALPADGPRRRLLDVGGDGWPDFAEHQRIARDEDAAEESRLLYVALTRAQHHLMLWWVENHDAIGQAKLTDLLTRDGNSPASLAEASAGTIEVSTLTELPATTSFDPVSSPRSELEVATFGRETDRTWRRVSFSSLSEDHPLTAAELPTDHALRTDEGDTEPETVVADAGATLPLAELPGGARFGTLVHEVLERLRFDDPDIADASRLLLDEHMRAGDWDFDPATLAEGIRAAVETPLGAEPDAPRLADLETAGLMRELVFEIPVRTASPAVTLAELGAVMDRHLPEADPYRDYIGELLGSQGLPFRGFMSGAIDLVGVLPDGRFVVMDYKSNSLPTLGEAPAAADYGPGPLAAEMVSHRYVLQATLYQVALHRYLQWRLAGYDPQRHLGGSTYLFMRGMTGPDTPVIDGARCGVARWQPPPEMVVALSRLFAGDGP